MSHSQNSVIKVEIPGRDFIQIDKNQKTFQFQGCDHLTTLLLGYKKNHGADPAKWPLPKGKTHQELLLKEFLLKVRGQWNPPYKEDELCHCRTIKTETVLQAIQMGAHSTEMVSRWTTASTACGTCRPESEKLIQYLLSQSDPQ